MKVLGMIDALTSPISFSTFPRFSHQQRPRPSAFKLLGPGSFTACLTTPRLFLTLSRPPGERGFQKVEIIRFFIAETRRIDDCSRNTKVPRYARLHVLPCVMSANEISLFHFPPFSFFFYQLFRNNARSLFADESCKLENVSVVRKVPIIVPSNNSAYARRTVEG